MNIENALARYVDYSKNVELIERDISLPEVNFVNSVIGPRRSGKTSLMLIHMKKLAVQKNNKVFINCEDIDFVGITTDDLSMIEKTIYQVYRPDDRKDIYLFIDEVQTFPNWSRWVRTLFDERKYKIFISGSTSDLSLDRLPSELRGRAINTLVLPFSFNEYLKAKKIEADKYPSSEVAGKIVEGFSDYLDFGGYPEVVKSQDPVIKHTLLTELYTTVVQRDLIDKYGVRKTATFKVFINSLFGSACRNISLSTIVGWFERQGTKIGAITAVNYLDYARSAFLFFLIYPYSRKIKERNTKPKLYVSDTGILGLFESDRGKKLENAVLVELIRRAENVHYYKSKLADVDFVLTKENKPCELIQVSYSISNIETYARETDSLLAASEELNCDKLTVVTFNEERKIEQGSRLINVLPAWKWLRM